LSGGPPVSSAGLGDRAHGRDRGPRGGAVGAGLLPSVVFAALVVACFAALIVTQHLKHAPTPIQEPRLTPSFAPASTGPHRLEAISFKLAAADEVTVRIEKPSGAIVATLVRDRPVARYRKLSLRWNGREGSPHGYSVIRSPHGYESLLAANRGGVAPAGEYMVWVTLRRQGRSVPLPRDFKLVGP
jgi:hypothetical protein